MIVDGLLGASNGFEWFHLETASSVLEGQAFDSGPWMIHKLVLSCSPVHGIFRWAKKEALRKATCCSLLFMSSYLC